MKKIVCVMLLLVMSACTYRMKDYSYTSVKPVIEVESDIDLSVNLDKKVKGNFTQRYFLGFPLKKVHNGSFNISTLSGLNNNSPYSVYYSKYRAAANYNAMSKNSDVDVLVNPLYNSKDTCYLFCIFRNFTIEVEGYGGNYVKKSKR